MKKILLIILALFTLTSCNNKKDVEEPETVNIYEIIDKSFTDNSISFTRNVKLNEEDYYAEEGWQYVIDDAKCIVDIYRYNVGSEIYVKILENNALPAKAYGDQYISAIINDEIGAIIWDGCSQKETIEKILREIKL